MPKLSQKDLGDLLPSYIMDLDLIVLMQFGSHLYGTDSPDSDVDFKGIYLPTQEQILLNQIPKSVSYKTKSTKEEGVKNTSEDIDCQVYSLHYFLKLAAEGQTVALDMLHAPLDWPVEISDLWVALVRNRKMFHTKSLEAFVGTRMYQVCGKKFQETVKVEHIRPILEDFLEEYGERAKKAADNEGVDWKAVSHAIRAATETIELLNLGTITFPLRNANFLRAVKEGKYDFKTKVQPILEMYMEMCEDAAQMSSLPERVSQSRIDKWLMKVLKAVAFKEDK